ncbi:MULTISPECIES: conjugal transfer protein TraC [unclassified Rhizobium]|uniref:conjugal transfer protein TraC n=1 Tax=unclassified Rhizobium TaxID=2613769 RepID=UPI0006FD9714|nr:MULTISPECIES: conjugal transfer protein TraC [unclassified Rhizobium]KQV39918.1 conjugal transfer protein TraC [Rhizobium sp. Root1212]KRD31628.1 conjugal transfer protein TraC [Rhizobium sp. Root268]
MKKPSSKIRDEIAKLQEQLKYAEAREAERIGRVALRAGLGEIEIEETELEAALEELAKRFRGGKSGTSGRMGAGESSAGGGQSEALTSGAPSGNAGEA